MISPNKSKMADGGSNQFRKMLIYPYWMKAFAQNYHAEMPTWPKTEPEVKMHDVIICTPGTNVGCSQRLYGITDPRLVHSSRNT